MKLGNGRLLVHGYNQSGPATCVFVIWCPQCQIKLTRLTRGREETEWQTPQIDNTAIIEYLDDKQLDEVTKKLSRYPALSKRWEEEFLAIKRQSDVVGRYENSGEGNTALAVLRENIVMATFETLSDL